MVSLTTFVDTGGLLHADRFRGASALDLVGGGLARMLASLLDDLEVGDDPVLRGDVSPHAIVEGRVFVAEGARVGPTAYIHGPAYVGPGAEVRHGAFARGTLYLGRGAVFGHATEAKNAALFDGAKAGHFAYIGDSLLGRGANLGAGTKLANLKLTGSPVKIEDPATRQVVPTGLRKLGAVIGDDAQTGCNAVLSPGTLLLPGSLVMPCAHVRGTVRGGRSG